MQGGAGEQGRDLVVGGVGVAVQLHGRHGEVVAADGVAEAIDERAPREIGFIVADLVPAVAQHLTHRAADAVEPARILILRRHPLSVPSPFSSFPVELAGGLGRWSGAGADEGGSCARATAGRVCPFGV